MFDAICFVHGVAPLIFAAIPLYFAVAPVYGDTVGWGRDLASLFPWVAHLIYAATPLCFAVICLRCAAIGLCFAVIPL